MNRHKHLLVLISVICASLILPSCASGPQPPQKGTPAFYWQAANETFTAGDYVKTNDHLGHILQTDNEFTARALPWSLVLSSGMTKGFMELADAYEYGARANKANPTPFRKQVNTYRTFANGMAMQFIEAVQKFEKMSKDQSIPLAYPYPTGSAAPVPQLTKAGNGIMLTEPEMFEAQRRTLEKAVLLQTCRAVGAPDDTAKTQQIFKAGNVQAPREAFIMTMAKTLSEQSELYSRQKLDQPEKAKLFDTAALEALKLIPENKETKELSMKLQKRLKAQKAS